MPQLTYQNYTTRAQQVPLDPLSSFQQSDLFSIHDEQMFAFDVSTQWPCQWLDVLGRQVTVGMISGFFGFLVVDLVTFCFLWLKDLVIVR